MNGMPTSYININLSRWFGFRIDTCQSIMCQFVSVSPIFIARMLIDAHDFDPPISHASLLWMDTYSSFNHRNAFHTVISSSSISNSSYLPLHFVHVVSIISWEINHKWPWFSSSIRRHKQISKLKYQNIQRYCKLIIINRNNKDLGGNQESTSFGSYNVELLLCFNTALFWLLTSSI